MSVARRLATTAPAMPMPRALHQLAERHPCLSSHVIPHINTSRRRDQGQGIGQGLARARCGARSASVLPAEKLSGRR